MTKRYVFSTNSYPYGLIAVIISISTSPTNLGFKGSDCLSKFKGGVGLKPAPG